MDTSWQVRAQSPETSRRLEAELQLPACVARFLAARGLTSTDEVRRQLHPSLAQLSDPALMPQMELAVERILVALRKHEKILVHGDYDVDGLAGSVLLHRLLQLHGAETELHIPHRRDGYSLGQSSIDHATRGQYALCLTVDHGTASPDGIAALRGMGCDVIIVDHHQPDGPVPPATAVLNPGLVGSTYPLD